MKNRIYPNIKKTAEASELETDETSLQVKALLLWSEYKAPNMAWEDATFGSKFQGRDWPGVLEALTAPYSQHDISLSHVRFRIIGKERTHYETEIIAAGPPGLLCEVASEVNREPIVYDFVREQLIQTTTLTYPFIADMQATFGIDEAGLVNYLAGLASSVFEKETTFSPQGVAVQQTASIIEVNADLLNDGGFAEGGTPGFRINARVAAPSKRALDCLLDRWSLFCSGHDALQTAFVRRKMEIPACDLQIRERGNSRLLPTQFLVAA